MTNPKIESLVNVLHDDRDGLRQFAMRRLVAMGKPAIPTLIEMLQDPKDYTRESAAIALATMGKLSIPFLIEAMKHPDRRTRWNATWVLSSMGTEARNAMPAVKLPAGVQKPAASDPALPALNHGVWSDSWLTKIKQQLHENQGLSDLGSATPELG